MYYMYSTYKVTGQDAPVWSRQDEAGAGVFLNLPPPPSNFQHIGHTRHTESGYTPITEPQSYQTLHK